MQTIELSHMGALLAQFVAMRAEGKTTAAWDDPISLRLGFYVFEDMEAYVIPLVTLKESTIWFPVEFKDRMSSRKGRESLFGEMSRQVNVSALTQRLMDNVVTWVEYTMGNILQIEADRDLWEATFPGRSTWGEHPIVLQQGTGEVVVVVDDLTEGPFLGMRVVVSR